jgi:hypothetical protein
MLQIGRSRVRISTMSLTFKIYLILPALGFIELLTEMSTRISSVGKAQLARKADKLTVICEPIV